MSKDKYLDEFIDKMNESNFIIDGKTKGEILNNTYKKIRNKNKWLTIKSIVAAFLIIVVIIGLIPNTSVYAFCQKLFSFIPGIGVVQSDNENSVVKSVLEETVRVEEGNEFIEIRSAYIVNKILKVSIKTNVGAINIEKFNDVSEFKEYFIGETLPNLYLLNKSKKVKSIESVRGGPSYEKRVYSVKASFYLEDENINSETFKFIIEGFNKTIEIKMSPVKSGTTPESMGNVAIIDNVLVFADISRQGDVLEVLLSAVAPKEYKNINFYLYEWKKEVLNTGVYIMDKYGNIYEPDDNIRKQNDSSIDTFYFNIPQDKEGLKLIIPQILYDREYNSDIKIKMPEVGKEVKINKEIDLGENLILVGKATIIPANDPLLPENFKSFNCLRIDTRAIPKEEGTREMICRVIPNIEVLDGMFGYIPPSYGTYCDLWSRSDQNGYSITEFENMEKTKKILLNLDVECSMIGPWEIEIK